MEAREKSLRIYDTKKTFFSKLSSTFSKILTPTKTGINNLLISIKRTGVLKSYNQCNECKDDSKKEALESKYEEAYSLYLDSIDQLVIDTIYKRVKVDAASEFEKDALSKYYNVIRLKENDEFEYELGLNPRLEHRPALRDRGELRLFYGFFKLVNGGFGFEVMSKEAVDAYAREYSKSFDSSFSPWKTNYEAMAKKTVIKQALKYAPVKADFRRALSTDGTIKNEIAEDMSEIPGEDIFDAEYSEQSA